MTKNRQFRPAFTLIELLTALALTAVLSTAVVTMLHAATQTSASIQSSVGTQWEVETALRRILNQTRLCTTFSVPTSTSGGTSFSLVTQPDPANGSLTYAVTYSLITAADGTKQLQENDSRYGNSILVHNVESFDVRYKSPSAPFVLVFSLNAGPAPTVSRILRITPRNQ